MKMERITKNFSFPPTLYIFLSCQVLNKHCYFTNILGTLSGGMLASVCLLRERAARGWTAARKHTWLSQLPATLGTTATGLGRLRSGRWLLGEKVQNPLPSEWLVDHPNQHSRTAWRTCCAQFWGSLCSELSWRTTLGMADVKPMTLAMGSTHSPLPQGKRLSCRPTSQGHKGETALSQDKKWQREP